jgi:hypothetical protein
LEEEFVSEGVYADRIQERKLELEGPDRKGGDAVEEGPVPVLTGRRMS